MDWADDVAYSVHDVEDGVHAGHDPAGRLADDADEREALCDARRRAVLRRVAGRARAGARPSCCALPTLRDLAGYDGSSPRQAARKRATSELTGRFAGAAVAATRDAVRRRAAGPLRGRPGRAAQ